MRDDIMTLAYKAQHPIKGRIITWGTRLVVLLLSPILLPLALYITYRIHKSIKEAQA